MLALIIPAWKIFDSMCRLNLLECVSALERVKKVSTHELFAGWLMEARVTSKVVRLTTSWIMALTTGNRITNSRMMTKGIKINWDMMNHRLL